MEMVLVWVGSCGIGFLCVNTEDKMLYEPVDIFIRVIVIWFKSCFRLGIGILTAIYDWYRAYIYHVSTISRELKIKTL